MKPKFKLSDRPSKLDPFAEKLLGNNYNFNCIFEGSGNPSVLERTQKLFNVCCNRANEILAVYFRDPSPKTIDQAKVRFGAANCFKNVRPLDWVSPFADTFSVFVEMPIFPMNLLGIDTCGLVARTATNGCSRQKPPCDSAWNKDPVLGVIGVQ
jgi:hypothetical protein